MGCPSGSFRWVSDFGSGLWSQASGSIQTFWFCFLTLCFHWRFWSIPLMKISLGIWIVSFIPPYLYWGIIETPKKKFLLILTMHNLMTLDKCLHPWYHHHYPDDQCVHHPYMFLPESPSLLVVRPMNVRCTPVTHFLGVEMTHDSTSTRDLKCANL